MNLSRRQLIAGLIGIGGWTFVPKWARAHGGNRSGAAAHPPLFEPEERGTLMAAMERVLPGATEASVVTHVEYWLRHPHFAGVQKEFRTAATVLDRIARERHQRPFVACQSPEQDAVLRDLQGGKVKEKGFDGAGFFQRLVGFTIEGFLADPRYGGNRDGAGWHFIGHRACWWAPRVIRRALGVD